ncbi:MAG: hypothetical protein H8E89_11055 [Candidatus Nitrosopelagicus sp.]|nr:hypothetical protein [Candidatus Nitrosopelagicus sp.]
MENRGFSEIEKRLQSVKTPQDIQNVLNDIVLSQEYQDACKQLQKKISFKIN